MNNTEKRIIIIGKAGSGKSTFASRLAKATNIPVIHLDKLYWTQNWVPTPFDEWVTSVNNILEKKEWIIDGNFNSTMEMRMNYADTIIFFDISKWVCLLSILKRWYNNIGKSRPDMNPEFKESYNLKSLKMYYKILKGTYNFDRTHKSVIMDMIGKYSKKNIVIIDNRIKLDAVLSSFEEHYKM